MPLLDFIDSFRYPLSGEYSMSLDTAMELPIEGGWALEIGSLFSETLSDACLDFLQGRKARSLPPWRRMMRSDWRPELNVIAERGEKRVGVWRIGVG
jgi:hypothetical protein